MSRTKTFYGITTEIWECTKATGLQHHTVYAPAGSNRGTATNDTPVGTVTLTFDFDPSAEHVTYTITKRPFVVPEDMIWAEIQETIDSCSKK